MSTKFKLAAHVDKWGYYGEITLTTSINQSGKVSMAFMDKNLDDFWVTACKAGAQIFWERYRFKNNLNGLHVVVEELKYQPIDTTTKVVIHITICALHSDLSLTDEPPSRFAKELRQFILA